MNKQEKEDLIQALYDIGGCEAEDEWGRGYDDGVNAAIEVVKESKVQGKVVVPRPVAEMIEIYKEKEISLAYLMRYFKSWHNKVNKGTMDSEALSWIVNNLEEFLDAWIHGYEVEKEQLYYVDFINDGDVHKRLILDHENGKHNIVDWSDNLIGLVQEIFTEQEIKAIDERYWPFAVKVEEE
ncbi:DUF1642 domain-containing protein [Enterococcus faecalis]